MNSPQDTTQQPGQQPKVSGVVSIEAPELVEGTAEGSNPKLDLSQPSIRDADQAWNLCKSTETSNKFRSERATAMELEYSGQPPFSQPNQIEKASSWQSNICTGIMQGIVDKKTLQFVKAITSNIYLTRSSLPTTWPDWKKKSDLFGVRTTRMVQGWPEYATFINSLAKENVLHGYGYAVFVDPITWQPKFFKQDVAYVPDEAPQHAGGLQFFVIKHDYLLNDFIDLFRDEKAAIDMGYNVPNCVRAAAGSETKNPREDATTTEFRKFAEYVTDGALGVTYATSSPRVVKTYLLWNREYDGRVSFWIISRDDGKLLRFAAKIFRKFEDVTTLFSFQVGNSHLHSSKGIGRMLIGPVKAGEKTRNRGLDNVYIGGMMVIKAPTKDRNQLQPVVHAPFIVMDSSIELGQQKLGVNGEEFIRVDDRILSWISQAGGIYINEHLDESGGKPTATQVNEESQREDEADDLTEGRWRDQFMGLVGTIQMRAYTDANIGEATKLFQAIAAGSHETEEFYDNTVGDRRAIQTIVDLLKDGLSADEIRHLRRAPPSGYAHTDETVTSQGILAVKKGYTGNPNIDQVELDKRSVEALAGPDAAKALIIDQPDQTVMAEATRMQMQESATMQLIGQQVPVSPRDNHLIHGDVVMKLLQGFGPQISQAGVDDGVMKQAELNLNHLGDHLNGYLQRGGVTQNAQFKQLNDFYRTFKQQFVQAVQIHEAHKVAMVGASTPDHAAAIMGHGTNTPPPVDGSAAVAGAVSAGAPQNVSEIPMAGADLDFEAAGKETAAPQPAAA